MSRVPVSVAWVAWSRRQRIRQQLVEIRAELAELEGAALRLGILVGDLLAWTLPPELNDPEPRKQPGKQPGKKPGKARAVHKRAKTLTPRKG